MSISTLQYLLISTNNYERSEVLPSGGANKSGVNSFPVPRCCPNVRVPSEYRNPPKNQTAICVIFRDLEAGVSILKYFECGGRCHHVYKRPRYVLFAYFSESQV